MFNLPRGITLVYIERPSYKVVAGWVPQNADSETETSKCSWDLSLRKAAGLGRERRRTAMKTSANAMGHSEVGSSELSRVGEGDWASIYACQYRLPWARAMT